MFGSLAKRVEQIEDPSRIPEVISRAFHTATNGRAGTRRRRTSRGYAHRMRAGGAIQRLTSRLNPAQEPLELEELERLLRSAQRPLVIIGGHGWCLDTREAFHRFASLWDLPVAAAFRYQDSFDNNGEQYVGDIGIGINPKLKTAVHDADLVLAICVRLGEVTTSGYTIIDLPTPSPAVGARVSGNGRARAASIGHTSLSMRARIGLPMLFSEIETPSDVFPGQVGVGSCVTTIWHGRSHDPNPAPSSLVRSYPPCAQSCRKILLSPMVLATTPRGCTDTIATARLAANSHPLPVPWAMGCRQQLPPNCCSPSALQLHFQVMAVS